MSVEEKNIIREDEISNETKMLKNVLLENREFISYLSKKGKITIDFDQIQVIETLENQNTDIIIQLISCIQEEIKKANIFVLIKFLTLSQKRKLENALNDYLRKIEKS